MISHCDFCRWVTENIKTMCPCCGRGIDLDFEHSADYFLSHGYRKFKESWETEDEDNSDEINGTDTAAGSDAVFNENFADFCGTSVMDDKSRSHSVEAEANASDNQNAYSQIKTDTKNNASENTCEADFLDEFLSSLNTTEINNKTPEAPSSGAGDFNIKIDSSAIDGFRNNTADFSAGTDSFININTEVNNGTASGNARNGAEYGDFGVSGRTNNRNLNTRDASFEDEYERQRRAALARERRQAFFDRLRSINPRTVLRVVAVLAIIGVGAYIWSMRYVIIEGITNFLISLIPPAVIIIIIVCALRSLFRRRW